MWQYIEAIDHRIRAVALTAVTVAIDEPEKICWAIAFSLLLVMATVGNSMVSWFIIARRRLAKACNCFMMSITLSDFALIYVECVFRFVYLLEGHWRWGFTFCRINKFLSEFTTASNIFMLTMASYDRYRAIVKPFEHKSNWKMALLKIITCWILALLLSMPPIFFSKEYVQKIGSSEEDNLIKCEVVWPDQDFIWNNLMYRTTMFIVTFLLPFLLMTIWNVRIGFVLNHSISQFNQEAGNQPQIKNMIQKRKNLVRCMWIILIIFCTCWLPYQIFRMYETFQTEPSIADQRIAMAVYWLAIANAAVNPFLFYRMDKKFQENLQNYWNKNNCFPKKMLPSLVTPTRNSISTHIQTE